MVLAAIFNLERSRLPKVSRFVWYGVVVAAIINLHLRAALAATANDCVRGRQKRLVESGRHWSPGAMVTRGQTMEPAGEPQVVEGVGNRIAGVVGPGRRALVCTVDTHAGV